MSRQFTRDFLIEVQKGNVPGHSMVHKFGHTTGLAVAWQHVSQTPFDITDFRTSAVAMRVKAGNVNDTAAGSGAQEITINGIDSTLAEVNASIATAGTSASSNFAGTWWRVHRAWVSATGAYTGANTADVVIEDSGAAADFLTITADEGQSQYTGWTVPTGKTAYLLGATVSAGGAAGADVRVFTRRNFTDVTGPTYSAKRLKLFWPSILSEFNYSPKGPELSMPALTDIWFEARRGGAGQSSDVAVDFELLCVDD